MSKRKTKIRPAFRITTIQAVHAEQQVRAEAAKHGVELCVSTVTAGISLYPHWTFRHGRRLLMSYWPSSSGIYIPQGGIKSKVDGPGHALEVALALASGVPPREALAAVKPA